MSDCTSTRTVELTPGGTRLDLTCGRRITEPHADHIVVERFDDVLVTFRWRERISRRESE